MPYAVREDVSLNQLRLIAGRPEMSDDEVRAFHDASPLLFRRGEPVPAAELAFADGLFLGLDLRGDAQRRVGYRAREGAPLLDLTPGEPVGGELYWEPVHSEEGNRLALIPRKFYLLMSDEAVSIPPSLSAEMTAYDPTSGELRTHYAGFFDPGFGFDPAARFHGLARRARGAGARRVVHDRGPPARSAS